MSLIIKGVDMPKSCGGCFVGDRTICRDGCPLGKIPTPHGRLIDADEQIKIAKKWIPHPDAYIGKRNADIVYYLEQADTVIEAEE